MTESREGAAQRMLHRAADVQRAHPALVLPFAVVEKFGDDRASQLVDVTFVDRSGDDRR
jgi:hypothetical protein